jgi:hypothetical protein
VKWPWVQIPVLKNRKKERKTQTCYKCWINFWWIFFPVLNCIQIKKLCVLITNSMKQVFWPFSSGISWSHSLMRRKFTPIYTPTSRLQIGCLPQNILASNISSTWLQQSAHTAAEERGPGQHH